MKTESLIPRLNKSFQKCTKVSGDSGIYRCERIYKDTPRSVYFFKASPYLPNPEELFQIQQDIVGPSYFSAKDASRWNHYFVFVSDDEMRNDLEFREKQRSIERNKDYARKLIVFDSELDEFIDHSITPVDADAPAHTIYTDWTHKLAAAGLFEIQTDRSRAPLIRKIREGKTRPDAPLEKLSNDQRPVSPAVHQIERFTLNCFGSRAIKGEFKFGRINLIHGPNGSGKTSLLEAIEHFFCGATYRSGGHAELLDAKVNFAGLSQPVEFQQRNNSYYQDCDQRWYGRTVNRGNLLWQGFSRFNFLNTDAAVHFSTDNKQQDLADALSKIALGPEATFTWNRIGEFERDLVRDLGPINSSVSRLKESIAIAMKREAVLKLVSPQIEASIDITCQILAEIGWGVPEKIVTPPDAKWFVQFQPLRDFVSVTRVFGSIRSCDDLEREILRNKNNIQQLQDLNDAAIPENNRHVALLAVRESNCARRILLERLEQFLVSGLVRWVEQEAQLQRELSIIAKTLIPLAELDLLEGLAKEADCYAKTVEEFETEAKEQLSSLRHKAQALEREQAAISRQLSLVDTLVSKIHSLGHEYAEQVSHAQECPLCRTPMGMAELIKRIQDVGDQKPQFDQFKTVSKSISETQALIDKWKSAVLTIKQVCQHSNDPLQLSLAEEIQKCRKRNEKKQNLNAAMEQAQSKLESTKEMGFTVAELSSLREQFDATPEWEAFSSTNLGHVRELCEREKKELLSIEQEESQLRTAMAETAKKLQLLLNANGVQKKEELSPKLQSSLKALKGIRSAFNALPVRVRQQFVNDLPALTDMSDRTIKKLDDLSAQIQDEHVRNKELDVLKAQLDQERKKLSKSRDAQGRMQGALDVLRDIKENHSLEDGVSSFLSSNLKSIQRVFSKIHVPHELQLPSLDSAQLERIGCKDKNLVKLCQISTGQRAALMLSVFLTLNLSLRNGPPQVLIDDPIAHIDDLNALSFLDYLADIAESGNRQIFFATANDKLANLFQKKMEFMGAEFCAIKLKQQHN